MTKKKIKTSVLAPFWQLLKISAFMLIMVLSLAACERDDPNEVEGEEDEYGMGYMDPDSGGRSAGLAGTTEDGEDEDDPYEDDDDEGEDEDGEDDDDEGEDEDDDGEDDDEDDDEEEEDDDDDEEDDDEG